MFFSLFYLANLLSFDLIGLFYFHLFFSVSCCICHLLPTRKFFNWISLTLRWFAACARSRVICYMLNMFIWFELLEGLRVQYSGSSILLRFTILMLCVVHQNIITNDFTMSIIYGCGRRLRRRQHYIGSSNDAYNWFDILSHFTFNFGIYFYFYFVFNSSIWR